MYNFVKRIVIVYMMESEYFAAYFSTSELSVHGCGSSVYPYIGIF